MKEFVKFFGVMVLAVAMSGLVACGDDTNPGTDEGSDTTVEDTIDVDVADTVETDAREVVEDEICVPECAANTCVDNLCGVPCACDDGYVCTDSVCVEEECVPNCAGKECGDSGCTDDDGNVITCGTCVDPQVCVEMTSTCEDACVYPDGLPTTWGKTGVVNYLHVPATADEKVTCFDYTGDGVGDCGLTGLASQVNGPLSDMMTDGTMAIMFEFAGVADFTTAADFNLQGLMGAPVTEGTLAGDMLVDKASYLEETCKPMIFFEGSDIVDGALAAGPGNFTISVPLSAELILTVHMVNAQIKADLTAGTTGVSATDGILSGVVTKAELAAIIASIEAECAKDPIPTSVEDICPYIAIAKSAMAMLFDMHQCSAGDCPEGSGAYIAKDAEHAGDAASLCLQFTLAESNVINYADVCGNTVCDGDETTETCAGDCPAVL